MDLQPKAPPLPAVVSRAWAAETVDPFDRLVLIQIALAQCSGEWADHAAIARWSGLEPHFVAIVCERLRARGLIDDAGRIPEDAA